jgi:hypothetical protein
MIDMHDHLTASMKSRRLRLFAGLFALVISSLACAKTTYTVDFTPPWTQGQQYTAASTLTESVVTTFFTIDETLKQQTSKRSVRFEADATALAAFRHGGLRKAAYVVRTLRVSVDGAPETDFLPPGTQIVAESTGVADKAITINGRVATSDQKNVLLPVLTTDCEQYNDEHLFGPGRPVYIGERWSLEGTRLKNTLGYGLGTIKSTSGNMRLDRIEGTGDAQVAVVSGIVTFGGIMPNMPPGIFPESGLFKTSIQSRIPASHSSSKREDIMDSNATLRGATVGSAGQRLMATIKIESKTTSVLIFP